MDFWSCLLERALPEERAVLLEPADVGPLLAASAFDGPLPHPRPGDVVVASRPEGGYYARSGQPESYSFRLEAPPNMDPIECDLLVRAQVRKLEKDIEHAQRGTGTKFLGDKRVLRQNPYDSPTTWEKRRGRSPTFASRDKWARIEAAQRNRRWLAVYAAALQALRRGTRDVLFPAGTWLMVRRYRCRCEPMLA